MIVAKIRHEKSLSPHTCMLPSKMSRELNLESNKIYSIKYGQITKQVTFLASDEVSMFYLSKELYDDLLLMSGLSLKVWRCNNDIYMGPVVGVLVNRNYITGLERGDYPVSFLKNIEAAQLTNCLAYYFTIDELDLFNCKVRGFTYSPKLDKVVNGWFPLPNVVYDRGVRFRQDDKKLVQFLREQLRKNPKIAFINAKDYLGKWQTYRKLSKCKNVEKYLPETIKYSDFSSLERMIAKYPIIYLKSYYGSRGSEVIALERKENKFIANYADGILKKEEFKTLEEVLLLVDKFTSGKSFIVQQGINLLKLNNGKTDMRILLEKNSLGEWVAIYNLVRIAKADFSITNTSLGADIVNYCDFYSQLSSSKPVPTEEEIAKCTIEVAISIEKFFGPFGELGMDMALDEDGNIYFLEANTKPDKEDKDGPSPQSISIFEYSQYLTKEMIK